MAENSKIEWCDHTFNPWIGCTKVSPGCQHCYAEQLMDKRLGKVSWGPGNPRQRTSELNWKRVEIWNREAKEDFLKWGKDFRELCHRRPRVFVASLADWLDPEVPIEWLADLLDLIRRCPHLDFLMLTKRPELWWDRLNAALMHAVYQANQKRIDAGEATPEQAALANWCGDWLARRPPSNIWIGTSVEDQQRADERIPALLNIPAKVRFLSCEPLLGEVDLMIDGECSAWRCPECGSSNVDPDVHTEDGLCYKCPDCGAFDECEADWKPEIHWIICGGESGPNARPMHPDWARSLRDQCQAAGVPFFFKQWGEWLPLEQKTPVGWYKAKDYFRVSFNRVNWLKGGAKEPGTDDWIKVGKAKSGRLLDGREWNDFPDTD